MLETMSEKEIKSLLNEFREAGYTVHKSVNYKGDFLKWEGRYENNSDILESATSFADAVANNYCTRQYKGRNGDTRTKKCRNTYVPDDLADAYRDIGKCLSDLVQRYAHRPVPNKPMLQEMPDDVGREANEWMLLR